jgi:hypothetical protein
VIIKILHSDLINSYTTCSHSVYIYSTREYLQGSSCWQNMRPYSSVPLIWLTQTIKIICRICSIRFIKKTHRIFLWWYYPVLQLIKAILKSQKSVFISLYLYYLSPNISLKGIRSAWFLCMWICFNIFAIRNFIKERDIKCF